MKSGAGGGGEEEEEEEVMAVEKEFVYEEEKHFTVSKTGLFFANDGFAVYEECKGDLVFRVDSYGPDPRDQGEVVLMDAHGRCLLTVRRKRPSLHNRWEGFQGEGCDGQKPIFSVKRSSMIGKSTVTLEMYSPEGEEYLVEGSFPHRNCTVVHTATKECVAEISRKVDASTNVTLGKNVFTLHLRPGFDGAFAMGLVLVLDQMNCEEEVEDEDDAVEDPVVDDAVEDPVVDD